MNPAGMSGSGVFVVPGLGEDGIWSLEQLRLAAIQRSFFDRSRLIRATRMEAVTGVVDGFLEFEVDGEGV